jgi:acetylornithine/N-succinyldiaminopimelate aminotransferase
VTRALAEERLVLNATGPTTVRLLPPLIIDRGQADDALRRLARLLGA